MGDEFIKDIVAFEAACGIERAFETAIDEYVARCKAEGRDPQIPLDGLLLSIFSGESRDRQPGAADAELAEGVRQYLNRIWPVRH